VGPAAPQKQHKSGNEPDECDGNLLQLNLEEISAFKQRTKLALWSDPNFR
jgi:hypothetical protein